MGAFAMHYTDPHRGVQLTTNLQTEVDYLTTQLARLIAQVEGRFKGPDSITMKVAKEWYGKQISKNINGFDYTYGFIHFTVSQKTLYDKKIDSTAVGVDAEEIMYSFHLKQNESPVLANNFVSASIFFSTKRGELEPRKVDFQLYGGADVESVIIFKGFLEGIKSQIEAFNADDTTRVAQNQMDLIPLITHGINHATH